MKRWAIGSIAFFATLAIGIAVVFPFLFPSPLPTVPEVLELPQEKTLFEKLERVPWETPLIMVGDEFTPDQVTVKNDEIWLGLFQTGRDYEIRKSKLNVQRFKLERTQRCDGEDGSRTRITVTGAEEPVVLFPLNYDITVGPVIGVFRGLTHRDLQKLSPRTTASPFELQASLREGFSEPFQIGGKNFLLHVVRETVTGRNRLTVVLSDGRTHQRLHSIDEKNGGFLGNVYWIGDLDRDDRPDLFLSLWTNDATHEAFLLLSTEAEAGEFVGFKGITTLGPTC